MCALNLANTSVNESGGISTREVMSAIKYIPCQLHTKFRLLLPTTTCESALVVTFVLHGPSSAVFLGTMEFDGLWRDAQWRWGYGRQ